MLDSGASAGAGVSVIIATNRGGPYLREAVASVAAQTLPAAELLIVDDGSPEPQEITDAAALVPGTRVLRQAPAGVSVARNRAVAHSSGAYLAFLDDDDRWHPRRLELQVAALAARPDAPVSYCGIQTIDASGTRVLAAADQKPIDSRLDVARGATGIFAGNTLVRRTAFQAVGGFHSRIRVAEDLDLALQLAELGPFVFVPETLVDYRLTGSNATSTHRALVRGIGEVLRLHRWAARERGDAALLAALNERLRSNSRYAWWSALRAARAQLHGGRRGAALGELLWAVRAAPDGLALGAINRVRKAG